MCFQRDKAVMCSSMLATVMIAIVFRTLQACCTLCQCNVTLFAAAELIFAESPFMSRNFYTSERRNKATIIAVHLTNNTWHHNQLNSRVTAIISSVRTNLMSAETAMK